MRISKRKFHGVRAKRDLDQDPCEWKIVGASACVQEGHDPKSM